MNQSDLAISVRGISKSYAIGAEKEKHSTLAESMLAAIRSPFRSTNKQTFSALADVSFDIQKGDVVGIIGRNGAGKSTLLKILSRITEPTRGEIDLYGRIGSLLEVGTGFHPELTGRENIFLNGAILGMSKGDIQRQFDEIVEFSGVEQFLDTPVKRYSSGMYVRLAFAVAAHLDSDILIVDEVLAVGDAEFQKKCLGKIKNVANRGRTVLFVSHNMQALQNLCTTAVHLEDGRVRSMGEVSAIVSGYLQEDSMASDLEWTTANAPGDSDLRLLSLSVRDLKGAPSSYSTREDLFVHISVLVREEKPGLCVGFDLNTSEGAILLRSYHTDLTDAVAPKLKAGINRLRCRIPYGLLNAGTYTIVPRIGLHNIGWIVKMEEGLRFRMTLTHGTSSYWTSFSDAAPRPGLLAPILDWATQ